MPPAYVKPYVKRGKTDANDAEAIREAVTGPTMRFVPVKLAEQQAALTLHLTRDNRDISLSRLILARGCKFIDFRGTLSPFGPFGRA